MVNGFEEYVDQARQLEEAGDIEGAIGEYKNALEEDNTNEELRREIINLTFKLGDFQQTVMEYFDWAEACQVADEVDDAIRIYEEILGLDTLFQKKVVMMDQRMAEDTILQIQETILAASGVIFFNMGFLYLARGDYDESIACLLRSMEFNPSDAKTHTLLGQVYMQKGMDKEAIGEFQEVVRLDPEDAAYAYEMLGDIFIKTGKAPQSTVVWFKNAGELYFSHDQMEEAIRVNEKILGFEPDNTDVLNRLGEIYAQEGYKKDASRIFDQLASIFKEEGLLDKVIAIYEKVLNWDPENIEARDRIIDIYRNILKMDPSNLTARSKLIANILRKGAADEAAPEFLELSKTYLEKGMRREALAVCKKLLDLDRNNGPANELVGDILFEQDKKEEALKSYLSALHIWQAGKESHEVERINEKLMDKYPGAREVDLQMARLYKARGDYDEALEIYERLLDEDDSDTDIITRVVEIYEIKEDMDKVLEYAKRLLNLEPSRDDIQAKIISIYEKMDNTDNLLSIYTRILEDDPNRSDIRRKVLEIYENTGDRQNLLAMYQQILEAEPDREDIRQKMIEYYASIGSTDDVLRETSALADVFLKNFEYEKAEDMYRKVLAYIPSDISIRSNLCNIYEMRGEGSKSFRDMLVLASVGVQQQNYDSALLYCRKMLDLEPDDLNIRKKYARIASISGNTDEAVKNYQYIANLYLDKKMMEPAIESLLYILEVDQDNVEYRRKIIDILQEQLRIDEVLAHYKVLVAYFLRKGQSDDAIVAAREAMELEPSRLDLREDIVDLFLHEGDLENGRFFSEELVEFYVNEGRYDDVVALYERISSIYKQNGQMDLYYEYRENIASIYERQVNFSKAVEEYGRLIESHLMDSRLDEAYKIIPTIKNLYEKLERPGEAAEKFGKLAQDLILLGRLEESLILLGEMESILLKLEDWEKYLEVLLSEARCQKDLRQTDNVVEAYKKRIGVLEKLERVDESIDEMFEIIALYTEVGHLDSALEQFAEVEKLSPANIKLLYRMGEILFEHEYFDRAAEIYERVLAEDPENYDAIARFAIIYAKKGDLEKSVVYTKKIFSKGLITEVIDAYKRKSEREIPVSQISINLGLFYQEMGFFEEAILEFEKAAKDSSKLLESFNLMALCFKKEGFTDLAIRQFERALEQNGYPEEDYLLIRYNLAETLLEISKNQESLSAFYECYMVDINYKDVADKIAMLNERISAEEG